MSAARQILLVDASKLRKALGRVLAPDLVSEVVKAATAADDEPVPVKKRPSPEALERARAWAKREAKR